MPISNLNPYFIPINQTNSSSSANSTGATQSGLSSDLTVVRNSNDRLATSTSGLQQRSSEDSLSASQLSALPDVPFEKMMANLTLTEIGKLSLADKNLNLRCNSYLERKGLTTDGTIKNTLKKIMHQEAEILKQQTARRQEERHYALNYDREFEKALERFDERQQWAQKLSDILKNCPIGALRGNIQKTVELLQKPVEKRHLEALTEANLLDREALAKAQQLSDVQKNYLLSNLALLNMVHKQPDLDALKKVPDDYVPRLPDREYLPGGAKGHSILTWFYSLEDGLEKAVSSLSKDSPPERRAQLIAEKENFITHMIKSALFEPKPQSHTMYHGTTLLVSAIELGSVKMVEALIKFMPQTINQAEGWNKKYPLSFALEKNQTEIAAVLRKAGAVEAPPAENRFEKHIADLKIPKQFSSPSAHQLGAVPKSKKK